MEPLTRELMMWLLDGAETTLLLFQLANSPRTTRVEQRPFEEVSEQQLLDSLRELEERGLAHSRQEKTWAEPSTEAGGIPECKLGREEMTWWDLTRAGRVTANQEVQSLRPGPKGPEQYLHILPAGWDPKDAVIIDPQKRKLLLGLLNGPSSTKALAERKDVPGFPKEGHSIEQTLEEARAALEALASIRCIERTVVGPGAEGPQAPGIESVEWKLTTDGRRTAEREWGKIG